jgi:hypothetical protein
MLTPKGRAVALLVTLRDRWDTLAPEQQDECAAILERLAATLRSERANTERSPQPLVGRLLA